MIIQSWDVAVGGKETSDYNACTTLGVGQNKYYVLDVWARQCEYPEAKRQVNIQYDKWHPNKITIEGGGSAGGKSIVQELKRETTLPVIETITKTDKVLRANLISPSHEANLCYLPEGEPWVADFLTNCFNFPNGKHDDDVDSFIMAMEQAIGGKKPMTISTEALQLAAGSYR
jgi:predicted phage terminase large subunit-like protein